eukprot:scaffold35058_cov118-Isochrysis_galbana.AAC.1
MASLSPCAPASITSVAYWPHRWEDTKLGQALTPHQFPTSTQRTGARSRCSGAKLGQAEGVAGRAFRCGRRGVGRAIRTKGYRLHTT